jgi:CPA2 family monovalent cation:H+ antiporter-2
VSFALGAFFAGMMLASRAQPQGGEETLPLRDAFAVLFFVSVGMLFDPIILVSEPLPLLAHLPSS